MAGHGRPARSPPGGPRRSSHWIEAEQPGVTQFTPHLVGGGETMPAEQASQYRAPALLCASSTARSPRTRRAATPTPLSTRKVPVDMQGKIGLVSLA